ncbi:VOC family protein [Chakrabartyella piscis]|uniref:VOC family protein n=1 Tax=Chakrabartyella piscis TaxID=2918914 RepID=UPI00295882EE|nr:VOC family protein [Chakrabartyella piscis]
MRKPLPLDHINLSVPNMEDAVAFYENIMGFTITHHFQKGEKNFVFMTDGNVVYELLEKKEFTSTVIDHLAYTSDDLQAEYDFYVKNHPDMLLTELNCSEILFEKGMDYFFIKGVGNERIEFCQKRS